VEINFLTPSTKGKRCWRKVEKIYEILVAYVAVNNYATEILIIKNKVYGLYSVKLLSTACLLLILPMTEDRESAKWIGKSNFRRSAVDITL